MMWQLLGSAIAGAICWYWGYWYGRREARRYYERLLPLREVMLTRLRTRVR
jgi:hypothetical protein